MLTYLTGFSLGLTLILAIGSQNAFVLKQGIRNEYLFTVCCICALSDAALIVLGVAGFGTIVNSYPAVVVIARYFGAAFLIAYGLLSLRSAFFTSHALIASDKASTTRAKAVLICLAFTWLNPHVYLDTVVLLGGISTQYHPQHWLFASGSITASLVFFFSLGYGARFLAPFFQKPRAWRLLELFVGLTMLAIAASLILGT